MKIALVILTLIVAAGLAGFFYLGRQSQTGAPPGLADGRLSPCPESPNCVSSEPGAPDSHAVAPLPADAWDALPQVIRDLGGEIVRTETDYIAATFTSNLFKFVDDVEFRRTEDAVHVRSASRVGHSDMGANKKRVAEIRSRLGG